MAALEKHIEEMSSNSLFDGTDFKLASCEDPIDERVARECGFTYLSVRLVKVLFSLTRQMFSPFKSSCSTVKSHRLHCVFCCSWNWQELVTLCSNPSLTTPDISFAGRHLSAAEFHSVLQSVGGLILKLKPVYIWLSM